MGPEPTCLFHEHLRPRNVSPWTPTPRHQHIDNSNVLGLTHRRANEVNFPLKVHSSRPCAVASCCAWMSVGRLKYVRANMNIVLGRGGLANGPETPTVIQLHEHGYGCWFGAAWIRRAKSWHRRRWSLEGTPTASPEIGRVCLSRLLTHHFSHLNFQWLRVWANPATSSTTAQATYDEWVATH